MCVRAFVCLRVTVRGCLCASERVFVFVCFFSVGFFVRVCVCVRACVLHALNW